MEAAIFLSHKVLVGLTEKIDRVWEWGEKYLKDCRKHLTLVDNYNSVFIFQKVDCEVAYIQIHLLEVNTIKQKFI